MTTLGNLVGNQMAPACEGLSSAARRRMLSLPGEPLFLADWDKALMIHYEVQPEALQPAVPFELDCWEGRAFISLVAFTLRRMRPRFGGRLAELLFKPVATHEFLNMRTYVRHGNETGILFLAEWLSNRLSVALGPGVFGLPYRFGHLRYEHDWLHGQLAGVVQGAEGNRFEYHADLQSQSLVPCEAGSIDQWLMERYTAFTCVTPSWDWRCQRNATRRFFRVWHPPWPQTKVDAKVSDQSLLNANWSFFRDARLSGANFSPGMKDVWMGWPHAVPVLSSLQQDTS